MVLFKAPVRWKWESGLFSVSSECLEYCLGGSMLFVLRERLLPLLCEVDERLSW